MTEPPALIMGIDGGGTKTTAWLARRNSASWEVIGKATGGSSNLQAVGNDRALQNLREVVTLAFQDAQIPAQTLRSVCLGCAGADRESARTIFSQWAVAEEITDKLKIVSDAELVLAAADPKCCGVVLISGTGSLAWGRDSHGTVQRSGGWGYLLGDEGSAFTIGQSAFQAVMAARDNRSTATILTSRICQNFSVDQPAALVAAVYGAADPRMAIASVAPLVFQAAVDRDVVATQILQRAADQLAQLVLSVTVRLKFSNPPVLALAGSVLTRQSAFREAVTDLLIRSRCQFQGATVITEPVIGALQIAAEF